MLRFTADSILSPEGKLLQEAVLFVEENGTVKALMMNATPAELQKATKLDGILIPGFVNAHCHLELSHMLGKVSQKKGFYGFATELIPQQGQVSPEEVQQKISEADRYMFDAGINGVGDISNVDVSFEVKRNSKIAYHTFIELLGFHPAMAEGKMNEGAHLRKSCPQRSSLSPHAPYTASAELLNSIASVAAGEKTVISIHNQESLAESEFTVSGTGKMNDLYKFFGTDISWYKPSGKNALRTILPHLAGDFNLILVHNTFTSEDDVKWAQDQRSDIYWCLCPRANQYIEDALPDIGMLYRAGCKLSVGTDSLASNHTLSLLDELKVIHENFPAIPVEDLLTWATRNGAEALQMEKLGTFEYGKTPGVVLLKGVSNDRMSSDASVTRIL